MYLLTQDVRRSGSARIFLDLACSSSLSRVASHRAARPITVVLVGLKTDARDDPAVIQTLRDKGEAPISFVEGMKLAKETNCRRYYECSALTHRGLNAVFSEAIEIALNPDGNKHRRRRQHCAVL